jgi:hypothetical protein
MAKRSTDPLKMLDAMARKLMRKAPASRTPEEFLSLLTVLARVAEEEPDFVSSLPAEDLTLMVEALHVPITAVSMAIRDNPAIIESCPAEELAIFMRCCPPDVQFLIKRRVDAIRGGRAN